MSQGKRRGSDGHAAPAGSPPPPVPAGFCAEGGVQWPLLLTWLDGAEARLDHPDPYMRAAAYRSRALIYNQIAEQTADPAYKAACLRASVLDESTAARIRFEHGIPTLMPRTEIELLGLRVCEHCGRPWQASAEGACEHCPRLLFGPTPATTAEAGRLPKPRVVDPAELAPRDPVDD